MVNKAYENNDSTSVLGILFDYSLKRDSDKDNLNYGRDLKELKDSLIIEKRKYDEKNSKIKDYNKKPLIRAKNFLIGAGIGLAYDSLLPTYIRMKKSGELMFYTQVNSNLDRNPDKIAGTKAGIGIGFLSFAAYGMYEMIKWTHPDAQISSGEILPLATNAASELYEIGRNIILNIEHKKFMKELDERVALVNQESEFKRTGCGSIDNLI